MVASDQSVCSGSDWSLSLSGHVKINFESGIGLLLVE